MTKLKERTAQKQPIGLYKLVGGQKNGELSSEIIKRFLAHNVLDLKTRETILKWEKELEFWEEYSKIYYHLEDTKPYYDLAKSIERFIEPKAGDIWLDAGCGPATVSYTHLTLPTKRIV